MTSPPDDACRNSTAQRTQLDTVPARIARVARDQHGVISTAQLAAIGMTSSMVTHAADSGRLHRVPRTVYTVGHDSMSFEAQCVAAALAFGPDAFVTGAAALYLYGIERRRPTQVVVVSTRRRRPSAPAGARLLTTRRVDRDERTRLRGVPVATVARALRDLADDVRPSQLAAAFHEAEYLELFDLAAVRAAVDRHRTRPGRGHRTMAAALDLHRSGSAGTQSWFERSVLDELLLAGAPMPRINCRVRLPDGRRVRPDLLWDAGGLVVEVDGPGHDRASARRADEVRDEQFGLLGLTIIRVRRGNRRQAIRDILRHLTVGAGRS